MGVTKNQKLTLTIESFGAQGEGVAKYEGMPVFVPYALPGEIADVLIVKTEKKYAFGKLLSINSHAPFRTEPYCPLFYKCGGCVCQHMSYAAQLEFKRAQVENCMQHIAGLNVSVLPVLGMEEPWQYRNKISMPVAGVTGNPQIGYYAHRSHRVIPVDRCLLAKDAADRACAVVKAWMVQERISPYQEETHTGLIRHVMTRMNRVGQLMLVLVINGRTLKKAAISCGESNRS